MPVTPPPPPGPKSHEAAPGNSLRRWFQDFMDLRTGSDRAGAVASIVNGKQMRGSNAWMLVCSIMIASLGLNLNSGAVIIGAMLISPLMNPILGVGLGIGTNDRELLWQALKNFGVSIIIALVTSVVYFWLTPIEVFTEEMQARTEPTILDALVAVFGGLAGIISVTRLDKTNAIPGVAIATALMPPLCVAGYGIVLAFSDGGEGFSVFWRAFYLFFLNSFFIAVTAYLIIRLLGFPYRKYVNQQENRRSQLIIGLVSIVMILPGAYVLQEVLEKQSRQRALLAFTERHFPSHQQNFQFKPEGRDTVFVNPIGLPDLADSTLQRYEAILQDSFSMDKVRLVMDSEGATIAAGIKGNRSLMNTQSSRIENLEQQHQELYLAQRELIERLSAQLDDSLRRKRTEAKVKIAFPIVENVFFGQSLPRDSTAGLPLVGVIRSWPGRRPSEQRLREERRRLQELLQLDLEVDSVLLVIEDH